MKRVLTAAVAIPIVLLLTIYSPQWLFAGVLGLVAALGANEFLSLGATKGLGRPQKWFLALPMLVTLSFLQNPAWIVGAMMDFPSRVDDYDGFQLFN